MHITSYTTSHRADWIRMRSDLFSDESPSLIEEEVTQIEADGTLKSQPFVCLLALDDNERPVGFIELTVRSSAEDCMTSPVGYIEAWYVDADSQRQGAGKALMYAGFEWARSKGCREVGSDARVENQASTAAHSAMGFVDAGVIRCFRRSIENLDDDPGSGTT